MIGRENISPAAIGYAGQLRDLCQRRENERNARIDRGPAYHALTEFGRALYQRGGGKLMADTYDAAVERFGYHSVFGASGAWTGIGEWSA